MENNSQSTCEYCSKVFSCKRTLQRHYERCKQKPLEAIRISYELQLQNQRQQYESQLQNQRHQLEQYESRIEKLEDKLFEIARQPKTVNNNTTTTQTSRNTAIINQLAPYDLTKDQITQLFYQHFNVDTFYGGPEEIAKLTAQVILIDPESQKPKVTCTDISRKKFKYVTYVDEEQAVQVDPGFQKTHDLIKGPLSQANVRVYVDELKCDDQYRDQWRKNEDFISDRTGFSDKMLKFM
jgi:hypothetical protein